MCYDFRMMKNSTNAALPVFCRGMRELESPQSIRNLARVSGISAAVISRLERGLEMPSSGTLWKWATGLADGRPNPEVWTTAVYAAAATWPDESQFVLIRYSDPVHDPTICWSLANAAVKTLNRLDSLDNAEWASMRDQYRSVGASRYPRFVSALRGPNSTPAALAAWFTLFCHTSPGVFAEAVQRLLEANTETEAMGVRMFAWLVDMWIDNGQTPITAPLPHPDLADLMSDPAFAELVRSWPRLTRSVQKALVTLATQAHANP